MGIDVQHSPVLYSGRQVVELRYQVDNTVCCHRDIILREHIVNDLKL
jgi:hypothetical protein